MNLVVPDRDPPSPDVRPCRGCGGAAERLPFSMAFQPIVDVPRRTVFAYEALVRGVAGESAASVLSRVDESNRYRFDQDCRIAAVGLAARLGLERTLSINFMPNAVYQPETCIRATLATARRVGFPTSRLMFEVSEGEDALDKAHLRAIFDEYRRQGFLTAIDDVGAGYSGLNLLAELEPDVVKVDMALVRDIDARPRARTVVAHLARLCEALGARVVAEGVESPVESRVLLDLGIALQQGYLFARPAFERLAEPRFDGSEPPS
ncbi:MAG TPA: EAL domain-containing protein [Burkholderiaceae bacterium]|nr:EAL domain-containing protein [Burkholderiaceae bacterium]